MNMTDYIKEDVIAGIFSGQFATGSLTLDKLSKHYQVSPTPVRAAVRELVREGYLYKDENRRLAIRQDRIAVAAVPPERPKDYYEIICNDLIRLSLKGEPVLLREETTAESYGVSRSTIQRIFSRLAGDGVLKHLPRRGWQLCPFRQSDLDAYIEIREFMELKAMAAAWPHLVDADLKEMLDKNRLPETPDAQPQSDNSLHDYLIEKADNPYITDFFERHGRYYKVLFDWEALKNTEMVETVRQHRAILEALLRRDRPAAEQALIYHIRNNHPVLKQIIPAKASS